MNQATDAVDTNSASDAEEPERLLHPAEGAVVTQYTAVAEKPELPFGNSRLLRSSYQQKPAAIAAELRYASDTEAPVDCQVSDRQDEARLVARAVIVGQQNHENNRVDTNHP